MEYFENEVKNFANNTIKEMKNEIKNVGKNSENLNRILLSVFNF